MSRSAAAFILQGRSDFNALTGFNEELARCLGNRGIEPVLIDLLDWQKSIDGINDALKTYGTKRLVGAFSFSGVGMELGEGSPNGNVWQQIKVPAISWMLDHPAYLLKRHTLPYSAVTRLYPTMDFVNFQRDYVKAPNRVIHCRLGAFTQGRAAVRREPKKGEVPLIIFAKTLGDTQELERRWKKLPVRMYRIIHDAIDHYWEHTGRWGSVVDSVLAAARVSGLEVQNDLPLFCFFIAQLDQYFRLYKGNLLIKELLALPVRVYGKGIEHIDTSHAKATILPPINYHDLIDEYRKALAVISMNPNAGDDCHDRNYHAFGTGVLPISDIHPWWAKTFPELQPYSYDFCNKPITAAVENVYANPEAAADLAWSVGQRMRTERPFQKSVEEAVDWALMQRYFEFEFASPLEGFVRSDLEPPKI